MIEDAVGGAVEVAVEVLADGISPNDMPKRYRKGCWWLTFIVAAIGIALLIISWR